MNIVDIILLISLGGFVLAGLWFGVIHMIGTLVGLVVSALVSSRLYEPVAQFLAPFIGDNVNLARVIAFFALFIIINRLVGLIFLLIEKIFKIVAIIPFLKTFNRLLGAVLGLLEGTLVLGLLVHFAAKFPFSEAVTGALQGSSVARALNLIGMLLAPLLPKAVRALKSVFDLIP
ncbi:hypothetical protein AMJ57_05705 [Parcubacteria bacterium SG8_24]|nr:MAG: hypothetical protein AMJ57_05705 [Parcubacteria bacterium SG8_24]